MPLTVYRHRIAIWQNRNSNRKFSKKGIHGYTEQSGLQRYSCGERSEIRFFGESAQKMDCGKTSGGDWII